MSASNTWGAFCGSAATTPGPTQKPNTVAITIAIASHQATRVDLWTALPAKTMANPTGRRCATTAQVSGEWSLLTASTAPSSTTCVPSTRATTPSDHDRCRQRRWPIAGRLAPNATRPRPATPSSVIACGRTKRQHRPPTKVSAKPSTNDCAGRRRAPIAPQMGPTSRLAQARSRSVRGGIDLALDSSGICGGCVGKSGHSEGGSARAYVVSKPPAPTRFKDRIAK